MRAVVRVTILLSLVLSLSLVVSAQKLSKAEKKAAAEKAAAPPPIIIPIPPPAPTALTGSLFSPGVSQPLSSLFTDIKARSVGDLLTISVLESTSTSINASSNSSRKSESTFGIPNAGGLGQRFLLPYLPGADPTKIFDGTGAHTFDGTGSTARGSQFSTTIAARVKEVLPNGDLVVVATKEVNINHEKQTMILSGIVRVHDITTSNVVLSSDLADLKVDLNGKGFVDDANKPGWLFRFMQKYAPF